MRRLLAIPAMAAGLALAGSVLASCGSGDGAGGTLLMSDVERAPVAPAAMPATAGALASFSVELYGELSGEDGNLVFSPYSAAFALAMTRTGATGETLEQMSAVLHADAAGDLDAGLNAIDQSLAKRPGKYRVNDKSVELELAAANQLFGQEGHEFHDAFLDRLASQYGAGMRLVDYIGATEKARGIINEWVAGQTGDRIPELIGEDILSKDTRLVLTNAIYLKAPWLRPFQENLTAEAPFTRLDGSTVQMQMMRISERFRHTAGDGYDAVELPYADGSLAMLVVVPEQGRFAAFEAGFDADVLTEIVDSLEPKSVGLGMPRFTFRTQASLVDALKAMGMPVAFDQQSADFSGMGPQGDRLFIKDVVHEAFIAVDESGTEAAAATAVVVDDESAQMNDVDLTVDRPFLFFIRDNETGALLFMGRVVDPAAE